MPWLRRRLVAEFPGAHLRRPAVQDHPRAHQRPAPIRGLDIRVADDVDDALDGVDAVEAEPEPVKADARTPLPTAP